jgi:hypothetical protein
MSLGMHGERKPKEQRMIELTKLEPAEQRRTYTFPGGETVVLIGVTHFLARESGTHRLKTQDGKLHIIPIGWLHVEIEADSFTL